MATILLIGTLDTKGMEFAFVRDLIVGRGHQTLVMDAGIAGEPSFAP
ncbi:MAG: Tm-1-like ATP-binding domain-containing protein, partial [Candidatus Promineifilaceae bacterium]